MDKGIIIFIAVGIGFLYFISNFIGSIQEDDKTFQNKGYLEEHRYDKYQSFDSIGQEVLDLTGADFKTQIGAWKESKLKVELLTLFPDFSGMKKFVNDRIRGDALQTKLLDIIDNAEGKYFSGIISAAQAKKEIDLLIK